MARFISRDDDAARRLLASAGVDIVREESPDFALILAATLAEDSRGERGAMTSQPPAPGEEFTSFGAWHINNQNECHSIDSGSGIVEFMTSDGPVGVLLESGDVMAVRRAEHRYLPLTTHQWRLRFDGGPDAELVATETGRAPSPWPTDLTT